MLLQNLPLHGQLRNRNRKSEKERLRKGCPWVPVSCKGCLQCCGTVCPYGGRFPEMEASKSRQAVDRGNGRNQKVTAVHIIVAVHRVLGVLHMVLGLPHRVLIS